MKTSIDQGDPRRRVNDSSVKPTLVSVVLCALSNGLERLAQWHTRRTVARKARQELGGLPNDILKDIGLNRGDIDNLADDLAGRACPCR